MRTSVHRSAAIVRRLAEGPGAAGEVYPIDPTDEDNIDYNADDMASWIAIRADMGGNWVYDLLFTGEYNFRFMLCLLVTQKYKPLPMVGSPAVDCDLFKPYGVTSFSLYGMGYSFS